MGKGKELPAMDFHAVVAKRDPALAERLSREGITGAESSPPLLAVVPSAGADELRAHDAELARPKRTSRRGLVPRADGREAGRITVYVPPELALRLRAYCFEHDLTMTDVARDVLVDALERRLRQP